jgi:hypothetical protein
VDISSRHLLAIWNMELQLETTLGKAALVLLAAQVASKPSWQGALCLLVCLRCFWLFIYKVRTLCAHTHTIPGCLKQQAYGRAGDGAYELCADAVLFVLTGQMCRAGKVMRAPMQAHLFVCKCMYVADACRRCCCLQAPYLWSWINHIWCGAWLVLVYVSALALAVAVTPGASSEAGAWVRLNLTLVSHAAPVCAWCLSRKVSPTCTYVYMHVCVCAHPPPFEQASYETPGFTQT